MSAERGPAGLVLHGVDDFLAAQLVDLGVEFSLRRAGVPADGAGADGAGVDDGEWARAALVVVNVDRPDAAAQISTWRSRVPDVLIAAYLAVPHRDRWEQAERAGADIVVNKGALLRSLRRFLGSLDPGATRRRRTPLFDATEVAGRLGLIQAVADTPVGPLAVFRLGSALVGVENVCPHAGVALSGGAVEDGVLTCPGHGSQFDLGTGERVRGPADRAVRTYTVIEEEGRVWLLWV